MISFNFDEVALLPADGDNVAIATKIIDAGVSIQCEGRKFSISHTVLEGHRFAFSNIDEGEYLLSWGLPFGTATSVIKAGEYVCNPKMLAALEGRSLEFDLPDRCNFIDDIPSFDLSKGDFQVGPQINPSETIRHFNGFFRDGGRGVGTRNYIVVIGTTSRTSSFARQVANQFDTTKYTNVDGVVAVTHTEGGELHQPNNLQLLLRTLAGFATHSNVGAFLMVDYSTESVNNRMVQQFMEGQGKQIYPIQSMPHRFMSIQGSFEQKVVQAKQTIENWIPKVNQTPRTKQSVDYLKLALQCGGSDAFSGVSGNPLAAYAAKEVIHYGGSANLAETDELIGAEPYALKNVKSVEVAEKFMQTQNSFQKRASWHGHSAEGNPSGGNLYRGLYNIAIKSIGAAMKRHPDVRLDAVIDYGEPMTKAGYYFMDSPGNDLESIAGQVASGCNMIYFVTGNGSITNFPFVPTIKIVTTTDRYRLLQNDMDVNAGRYQDGISMKQMGQELFDLTLNIASGQKSIGEKAGHSQISVWRDWRQTDDSKLIQLQNTREPDGKPLSIIPTENPDLIESASQFSFQGIETQDGIRTNQIGLVLPTSLCSSQISTLIAKNLNNKRLGQSVGISSFHGLVHTEGCGVSAGQSEKMFTRTLVGHLLHPTVGCGVLLEHGCEKTHNDHLRQSIENVGCDTNSFGWASVQLDGGIESVSKKVEHWFQEKIEQKMPTQIAEGSWPNLKIGLLSFGSMSEQSVISLTQLVQIAVQSGGTVVIPDNATFIQTEAFLELVDGQHDKKTLSYGECQIKPGLHIMDTQTGQAVETLTGLGATGVDLVIAHVINTPIQSHPIIPVLQFSSHFPTIEMYGSDLDFVSNDISFKQLLFLIQRVASREYIPKLHSYGNTDFQVTRGLLGISL